MSNTFDIQVVLWSKNIDYNSFNFDSFGLASWKQLSFWEANLQQFSHPQTSSQLQEAQMDNSLPDW